MIQLNQHIAPYRSDIAALCERFNVRRLYAFGSAVRDDFTADSDIDFMVDFGDVGDRYVDNYFGLKFALEDTLSRRVDLLEEKAIRNPYFLESISRERQLVYG